MIDIIKQVFQQHSPQILGQENMNRYAVILLLLKNQKDDTISIIFEKRASTLRRQPCEISFPGGKIEKSDHSVEAAAVRETCEELGIKKEDIEVINRLGLFIPSRHTVIYPFIAILNTNKLHPNPDEVDEAFTVPLSFFIENPPQKHDMKVSVKPDESFPFHLIPGGRGYPWRYNNITEYFYIYHNYVIWGMTAHIIYHFINELKKKADLI